MKKSIKLFSVNLPVFLIFISLLFQYSRSWDQALFTKPLHKLETDQKIVALTFDDGPSATRTPPLLELLDQKNVKATFFLLGKQINKYPHLAKKIHENGHLIGNHSYDHVRMYFKSPAFMINQIETTDSLIHQTGQSSVKYFRPPFSAKFIILPLVLNNMNKIMVTGTYDPPSEYQIPYDGAKVAEEVIANTKPGSIIYLHDGWERSPEEFIKSVDIIITELSKQGYKFVRIDY